MTYLDYTGPRPPALRAAGKNTANVIADEITPPHHVEPHNEAVKSRHIMKIVMLFSLRRYHLSAYQRSHVVSAQHPALGGQLAVSIRWRLQYTEQIPSPTCWAGAYPGLGPAIRQSNSSSHRSCPSRCSFPFGCQPRCHPEWRDPRQPSPNLSLKANSCAASTPIPNSF